MLNNLDISSLVLTTPRLKVREFSQNDVPAIQSYWGTEGFAKHIHLRFANAKEAWQTYQQECVQQRLRYYFVVELKGEVIGAIRLDQLPKTPEGLNLHLEMAPAHWGKGYTTEAAHAVLAWANPNLNFNFIQATAHPDNAASRKVLEKLGFQFVEKRLNYLRTQYGELQDRLVYTLLH